MAFPKPRPQQEFDFGTPVGAEWSVPEEDGSGGTYYRLFLTKNGIETRVTGGWCYIETIPPARHKERGAGLI